MLSYRRRVDIYNEYIPSQAIVAARAYQLSPSSLDSLLGINVQAELVSARQRVDRLETFGSTGAFHGQYVQLARLRRSVDRATASSNEVTALFNGIGSKIEAQWKDTFNHLSQTSASSDSSTTRSRLVALGLSFGAFTSGLGEEDLQGGGSLETLLTAEATPAQIQSLIVSHEQFGANTLVPWIAGSERSGSLEAADGRCPELNCSPVTCRPASPWASVTCARHSQRTRPPLARSPVQRWRGPTR